MPPLKTRNLRTRSAPTDSKASQATGRRASTTGRRESDDDLAALLGQLSTAMLRAPAYATDREIEIWLDKVCQALDVDRAGVFERHDSKSPMEMTPTWVRAPYPPDPPQVIADSAFRSIVNKVMAGESFNYSYASDLPPEMDDLKAWVLEHGPKAGAAAILLITRSRCALIVRSVVPNSAATCLFSNPLVIRLKTSRSREVSDS